jgi:hypothetical protein
MSARIAFSRLTASGHKPCIGADILASYETVGIFDGSSEGKNRDLSDTRNAHQPGADLVRLARLLSRRLEARNCSLMASTT